MDIRVMVNSDKYCPDNYIFDIMCGASVGVANSTKRVSHHVDHNYFKYRAFVSLRVGIFIEKSDDIISGTYNWYVVTLSSIIRSGSTIDTGCAWYLYFFAILTFIAHM